MGFLGELWKLIRGKVIFSMAKGFHTGKKGFSEGEWVLEGNLLGKCVKPRDKGQNEGKRVF